MVSLLIVLVLAGSADIRLAPGTQDLLRIPGVVRVAIADPSIVDVTTVRGDLLVVAKQRGRTSLTLWTAQGVQTRAVVVDDGRGTELARMIREVVGPGLRVETYSTTTVVDGQVDSIAELSRLQTLLADEPNVKVLVTLNPRVLPVLAQTITSSFQKQGLKDARATCVGQQILLEGSVADERELQKALVIAGAFYGQLTGAPTVR